MRSILLVFILCSISFSVYPYFYKLECEAWYKENGRESIKEAMDTVTDDYKEKLYRKTIEGYSYEVKWDINLDSFYKKIVKDGKNVLFTTARVPSFNHNDSFTDLNLDNGTRLSISCGFKPKDN